MATHQMIRYAIEARNLPSALGMCRQLQDPLTLADTAKLLHLLATDQMADQALFERSAVRWIQRLTTENPRLEWENLLLAAKAIENLDIDKHALPTLIEISYRPHRYPPDVNGNS